MPREDRSFRELTIWAIPITARTNGDRTLAALVNVTGVTIVSISPNTVTGTATGTLRFTVRPRALQWQAPGSPAPGAPVPLPAGSAGNVFVTLPGGDGSSMTANVNLALVPVADANDVKAVTLVVPAAQVRSFSTQIFFGITAQGAPTARVNDEVYLAYDPGDAVRIWPANEPSSSPEKRGTNDQIQGFPITVRVVNTDAVNPLDITIEFCTMTIDQG
jgi:hypothetical protein